MKPDRWKQIDDLLEAALERLPFERAAFLDSACADDESLRREVESLLNADARAGNFSENPVASLAANIVNEREKLAAGQEVRHYRVVSLLGKGGMGSVYLAEDLKLGRKVALKLLPDYFTSDQQRVRRFELEARATSALSHPNILVVHEIGSKGDLHFIVTEFVEGETLRERLSRSRMTIAEALDVAVQVASALATAHQAGIVHRDIKPENMILRADGLVKLLDFGLAKISEQHSSAVDAEAPTLARVDTEPGTILGTVNYMSPEQARGRAVDARTDIFSLGVILYEMLTGQCPFAGETKTDVLASILNAEAPSITRYQPDTPAELQKIVSKMLRKDHEKRYQTARDLFVDLKSLTEDLEFESRLDRSASRDVKGDVTKSASPGAVTRDVASGDTPSITELATNQIKRHRAAAVLALIALVVAASAIAYYLPRTASQKPIESLVILPFDNANNDPNTEYLSDGITETLINSFSQLPRLKVVARTTAFRYKSSDPRQAGRELGVRAVLTGKVIQQKDNLVVQVDLIDVADGSQIWGDRYRRRLSDLLTVQDEIARAITQRLRLTLTGEEQRKLEKKYTANSEAYEAYLLGRHWLNKRSDEAFAHAIDYFNQAIAKDADYALAYSGLADCYALLGLSSREPRPSAKEAALKALAIDDELSEAHASLGYIMFLFDWDWPGAERELRRALELNPNYPQAHARYSSFLSMLGRHKDAIAEARRALEIEPFSIDIRRFLGFSLCLAGEYDQAIVQLKAVIEMDQSAPSPFIFLIRAYQSKGMYEEALGVINELRRVYPDNLSGIALLARNYALLGKREEAKKTLGLFDRLPEGRYMRPRPGCEICRDEAAYYYRGAAFEALGDCDRAFEMYRKACEQREVPMITLKVIPVSERFRSDPRFAELLRCVGLPE